MDSKLLSWLAIACLFGMSALAAVLYLLLTHQEGMKHPDRDRSDDAP